MIESKASICIDNTIIELPIEDCFWKAENCLIYRFSVYIFVLFSVIKDLFII
jgi:hypothetical protein